jgi:hypothetical protein
MTRAASDTHRGRAIWAGLLASWLACVAVIFWLHFLELPDTGSRRLLEQASCLALGPLVCDWDTTPLWTTKGWWAAWAADFLVGVLSVALLVAFAMRPTRLTACLTAVGTLWWVCCGMLTLASL